MVGAQIRASRSLRRAISFLATPISRRISVLENAHEGEECYIFGDGASVKYFDLSKFSDKRGIAVGVMPHHRDFDRASIQYWILPEPMFFWPALRKGPYTSRIVRKRFQDFFKPPRAFRRRVTCVLSLTNFPVGFSRRTQYVFDQLPSGRPEIFALPHVEYFAGSVNASLTLAAYLGFRRAYLVGFDYTHNPPCAGHWYEIGPGIPQDFVDYNKDFFDWVMTIIDVVTVVPSPQNSYLPSIDYETLTGDALQFNENTDLLSQAELADLAVWTDYRIFPDS